jgi:hypothetical protein
VTATVDYWDIRQRGIVGILGPEGTIALDYLARSNGWTNPERTCVRPSTRTTSHSLPVTGLTPTGKILAIDDVYVNLQPQTVRGVDLAFLWNSPRTKIGEFNIKLNATRLLEFQRDPGPVIDGLLDARSQGKINVATSLPEGKDLIRQGGRPEWRGSASLSWSEGPVQIGTFHQYIGNYDEIGFLDPTASRGS